MKLYCKSKLGLVTVTMAFLVTGCSEQAANSTVAASEAKEKSGESELVSEITSPDTASGKELFASCSFCHTTRAGAESTVGPNLAGILGTAAGSKEDFIYSPALVAAGIVWTEEALDEYIKSPATYLPGGSMGFVGIADDGERKAVLAYLITKTNNEGADSTSPDTQGEDVAIWE